VRSRGLFRIAAAGLATIALLGLAACTPKKPSYVCQTGVGAASAPAPAAPPSADPPLEVQAAGEEAKTAVAEADVLTPDGRVPLVTVEQTPAGPEITSTPVADEAEAEAVAEAAAVDGDLVAVEPDSLVTADGILIPNDTEFDEQYALPELQFTSTWDDLYAGAASGKDQTVAVLDTGVSTVPDLTGKVTFGPSYIEGGSTSNDQNGHGTFIAGIIAARTNNAADVAGAAPAANILAVQVLNAQGRGLSSNVAAGVIWAADHGATVINLSLGGPNPTAMMQLAVRHAVVNRGVPVISSSGNTGKCGAPSYPAAFEEVLAVGATDMNNQSAPFSTTGPYVNVVAPGVDIVSVHPNSPTGVSSADGTSFSTPYASAAAAIVKARHPALDANGVYFRLITTAVDLGPAGWDPHFGSGLINVRAAQA